MNKGSYFYLFTGLCKLYGQSQFFFFKKSLMVYTINCSMPQNSQQQGRKCMTIDKWQWPLLKSAPCFTLMNLLTSQIKFTSRRQHLKDDGGSVTKSCLTLVTPWTIACRVPLFMDFPGKITGVNCHFLLQWHLPDPGIEPRSPAWQADSLLTEL